MCNCKWTEIILGIVILVFAFWQTDASQWIVAIAAALVVIHALACRNLASCCAPAAPGAPMGAKAKASKRKYR